MKPYPKAAGTLADSAHADGAPADGVHAGGALADDALADDVADDDFAHGAFADDAFADDALAGEAAVGEASANEIAHGDQDMTTLMQASRLQMTLQHTMHLLLLSCVLPPPAGATLRQTTGEETAIDQTTLRYELLDTPEVSLFSV